MSRRASYIGTQRAPRLAGVLAAIDLVTSGKPLPAKQALALGLIDRVVDTDLRAAHVVARRLASILKNTTMAPDRQRVGIEAAVTLATLRPNDSLDSLIARVVGKTGLG